MPEIILDDVWSCKPSSKPSEIILSNTLLVDWLTYCVAY